MKGIQLSVLHWLRWDRYACICSPSSLFRSGEDVQLRLVHKRLDVKTIRGKQLLRLGGIREVVEGIRSVLSISQNYLFQFDIASWLSNYCYQSRVTYLIDRSGVIRFVQKGVPENQDFLNELETA